MKRASLISFAVFVIIGAQANGDWTPWYWPPTDNIQILPDNPTSSDVVVMTLSGDWPDSCIPNGSAVSVTDNNIYFDVIWDYPPDIICYDAITPWQQTQSVGPLSPATYTVYARIVGDPYIPETYTPIAEFTVTDYQFVLNTQSITVPEGTTATFTVALLNPLGTVEVTVAKESGDPDITIESGALLTFDASNYSEPQTVIVSAEEDEDYLDGASVIMVSAPEYLTAEVTATEADNDTPPVLYVDVNAIGNNNGTDWSDAYMDLQDALNTAAAYPEVEEIRVAQGVYTPAEPNGNRSTSFNLTNITITGGYAGYGESDPNVRDVSLYKTILSGDLNGDDGSNFANNGENSHTVAYCNGIVAIDGLTISGGNAFGGRGAGAGLYNRSGCQLTATNCIFTRNTAMYGGGMFNNSGNITLVNCIFFGNSATGGGIYSNPCNLTLINCTVSNNSGRGMTGSPWYTYVTLTNCIFWGNGGTSESDQIGSGQFSINYSCIQGLTGSLGGIGNIDADPCFVGPDDGDYHLSDFSPCIDTGDPNYLPQPSETDLDGKPRALDGDEDGTAVVDMGAYEYGSLPPIEAVVKIRPRTLNLRSKGNWITCHISLPEDYNAADIEPDSIFLEDQVEADKIWVDKGEQVIMSKFSRSALQELLADIETPTKVELLVSGQLSDGTKFEGTDIIKLLNKAPRAKSPHTDSGKKR